MSNIVITGATGLIGRNLIKKLSKKNSILATSRDWSRLKELQKEFPHIIICRGDISSDSFCKTITENADIIYHLAALRALGEAEKNVNQCINTNINGTINLLDNFKGKRFITLSTDKAVQIKSVYGASKFIVERLVYEYSMKNKKTSYRVIRSGNVFGSTNSVISVWKNALENNKEINVTDLNATRFFCTVDTVIDYILKCDKSKVGVIGCMELKSASLKNLLSAMQIKYGKAKKINIIGRQVGENKHEIIRDGFVNSSKVKKYTVKELLKYI